MDRTFLMIKPDGVQRGLVGEIVARFEKKGLKLVAAKFERLPESRVMEHYAEHVSKPFFPGLKSYIMSGPCFLMVWEGKNVVSITRQMIGATNPAEALPGTIRGDFALEIGMNVIHGSDSNETAKREIAIHFKNEEITSYERIDEKVLYE
ncbi:MAG: nucleoside-diphosphate kinase [Methanomicrobium sp.]|jgi:nucleoside-diphosphate kinase|uniref:nucleoside-diphosphate kinase n=1 Tax=Methanomicrobium mobile TaxID=2205 RepID=UPI0005B27B84|nr:nucleoside-diphosphate kinase [Methanomicrobium mobile]MBO7388644.1 nucleoside-diphosphate kinase [Methanomicrobium sp.]MBP5083637.1 nucleoside-diphosphate kinase [Methanomicrobium sp.]MBP5474778.1 nucleoside-diphosphate kinase [Methanomicrobium sp.]MBQ3717903.1 nucleoside-diphosphate kinase [Methanomicrobium sp.]MBQ4415784.1 nucleoside-diphosphate kinase [Methanomicrobium sp.]